VKVCRIGTLVVECLAEAGVEEVVMVVEEVDTAAGAEDKATITMAPSVMFNMPAVGGRSLLGWSTITHTIPGMA
jgi:hypothetical protein